MACFDNNTTDGSRMDHNVCEQGCESAAQSAKLRVKACNIAASLGSAAKELPAALSHCHLSTILNSEINWHLTRPSEGREGLYTIEEYDGADNYVKLKHSMLVRLHVPTMGKEPVCILSSCEHIGSSGLRLILPCGLGLKAGSALDMELFLDESDEPVAARGKIQRTTRIKYEDSVKYVLETKFSDLSGHTEKRIAAFMHAAAVDGTYDQLIA